MPAKPAGILGSADPAFTGGVYEQLDTHDVQDPELGRV